MVVGAPGPAAKSPTFKGAKAAPRITWMFSMVACGGGTGAMAQALSVSEASAASPIV